MGFSAKNLRIYLEERLEKDVKSHYSSREIDTMLLWLLEHIVQITQVDILLNKEVDLSDSQQKDLTQAIQRLNQEEPIQYIIGEAEFYGRPFLVNPSVLIPRHETEELVHYIIKENQNTPNLQILDIGTGSGCIAITLAKELKQAEVWAIDYSEDALLTAKQNAFLLNASVNFQHQNILKSSFKENAFTIVVSNPPYVLKSEAATMRQNVLQYEPASALFVEDADPLLFYRRISELCRQILKPAGRLYFETNERYASEVASIMERQQFNGISIRTDMQSKNRFVTGCKPINKE